MVSKYYRVVRILGSACSSDFIVLMVCVWVKIWRIIAVPRLIFTSAQSVLVHQAGVTKVDERLARYNGNADWQVNIVEHNITTLATVFHLYMQIFIYE